MKTKSLLITTGLGLIGGMLGFVILAIVFLVFFYDSGGGLFIEGVYPNGSREYYAINL